MPGRGYLKVTGVLFIIGAIILLITYPVMGLLLTAGTVATGESRGWLVVLICVAYTVAAILQLLAGIKGVKGCDKKEAAPSLKKWGIVVLVITALSSVINLMNGMMQGQSIVSSVITVILSFVLPLLYMYGASLNERA